MTKEMPKFRTDQEAAEFWEKTDSTEYLESGHLGQFEWQELEDRCEICGSKMRTLLTELTIFNRKVTIHNVKKYHCDSCSNQRLSREFKKELPFIAKELFEVGLQFPASSAG